MKVSVSRSRFERETPGTRILSAAHSTVSGHQCCVLRQLTEYSMQSCYVQLLAFIRGPNAIGILN
jgi:hypothetical protein